MARIFITYRSEDPGWSVALDRELSIVFGADQVFRASRTMQLGESFPERIRNGIANASVLLAVIGPRWLEPRDDGRRRIDDPDDWVRREIRLALEHDLLIVPVLVDGVRPLSAAELPEDIRDLADRQFIRLSHKEAEADIGLLIERLLLRVPGLQVRTPYSRHPIVVEPVLTGAATDDTPSTWLVLAGLGTLLLSLWLPWMDGTRVIEIPWKTWEFAMILPRGALSVAALSAAVVCLLRGRFEAAAMGVAGVCGLLAVIDPLWVLRQYEDDRQSGFSVGIGLWTTVASGVILLAAVGVWVWRRPASESRHSRQTLAVVAGVALVLFGQILQMKSHHHWFHTWAGSPVLLIVAGLLIPPRIPESVRIAALSGFSALAVFSLVAAVNYLTVHHEDQATLNDSMGRIVLNIVIALGVWVALSRPVRVLSPSS